MDLYAHFETTKGSFVAKLYKNEVPNIISHFKTLVTGHPAYIHPMFGKTNKPFYSNLKFHYVSPDAYIQTGCYKGDGTSYITPEKPYEKTSPFSHISGSLSVARAGNIEGGQFFICLNPMPHFDGIFTVFGKVEIGLEVVSSIELNDVLLKIWLEEH